MKKLLVCLVLLIPVFCSAQSEKYSDEYASEITFYGGGLFGDEFITAPPPLFEDVQAVFDDDVTVGFRYGYYLNRTLQFEGGIGFTPSALLATARVDGGTNAAAVFDVDTFIIHFNLVAHLTKGGPVIPYVTGGIGAVHFNFKEQDVDDFHGHRFDETFVSETDFAVNAGGGVKIPLKEDIAVRMDGRVFWMSPEFSDDDTAVFTEVTGGVSILFNF